MQVPIDRLFGSNIGYLQYRMSATEGIFVIACSIVCEMKYLPYMQPCAIGASGVIGQKSFRTGSYLIDADGVICAVTPFTDTTFAAQPISPTAAALAGSTTSGTSQGSGQSGSEPWERELVCEFDLESLGTGPTHELMQVRDADCSGAPTLKCAPNCQSMTGRLMNIPNGKKWVGGSY